MYKRQVGAQVKTTTRTIYSCEVEKDGNDIITIRVTGNGFLYNMVRIICLLYTSIVHEMKDAISLGVGEPDFDTPWHIRDEGIYSLEKMCIRDRYAF